MGFLQGGVLQNSNEPCSVLQRQTCSRLCRHRWGRGGGRWSASCPIQSTWRNHGKCHTPIGVKEGQMVHICETTRQQRYRIGITLMDYITWNMEEETDRCLNLDAVFFSCFSEQTSEGKVSVCQPWPHISQLLSCVWKSSFRFLVFRWLQQVLLPRWNVKPVVFLRHVTGEWCNAFFINNIKIYFFSCPT